MTGTALPAVSSPRTNSNLSVQFVETFRQDHILPLVIALPLRHVVPVAWPKLDIARWFPSSPVGPIGSARLVIPTASSFWGRDEQGRPRGHAGRVESDVLSGGAIALAM